ncbi:MAG TPA: BatD family protein, partial [Saprospiraceae bacterium]|nr:BatD family protein [Saprospiraceae bacterium]
MRKRKSNIHSRIFIALSFFFCSGYAVSQDPLFTASASSTRILQNSVFEVQFELQNANGNNFQPPPFNDFKVVGGPSMGSSTMIVNGKVSRSQSWSYSLLATSPGTFTIGAASIIAGRRKLNSKPISVSVVPAEDLAKGNASGDQPIKLIAYVKPGEYYPGQQIVLEYKLLFTENIQSANTISEDDYADFFIQNFNSFSKEATYETINGVMFASRIIKAIALFPHQSGSYTIDPMVIMVGINAPYPGNQ